MRMELPQCNLKVCRFYADGNCSSKIEFKKCQYALLKLNEKPHAHWIEEKIWRFNEGRSSDFIPTRCYKCSRCNFRVSVETDECERCGAKMDEEEHHG